jgi:hypothetical protein
VYVASQGLEQLLELMANDGDTRPLVVTSRDRLDIVMGLLASQVCSWAARACVKQAGPTLSLHLLVQCLRLCACYPLAAPVAATFACGSQTQNLLQLCAARNTAWLASI